MIARVLFDGNLGGDPKVINFEKGNCVVFSIAASEGGYTTKDGNVIPQKTYWYSLVAFNRLAESIANNFKKGDRIEGEGYLKTRTWDKDGVPQVVTEIHIERFTKPQKLISNGNINGNVVAPPPPTEESYVKKSSPSNFKKEPTVSNNENNGAEQYDEDSLPF